MRKRIISLLMTLALTMSILPGFGLTAFAAEVEEGSDCSHVLYDTAVTNGDGTHTGVCELCGETVTANCEKDDWSDYDEEGHSWMCFCGYVFSKSPHTYSNEYCYTRSLAGHWMECDNCFYEEYFPHTESSGTCEICFLTLTTVYDIYVGGVGLENGQYLDVSGRISDSKPTGGYAYYENGVLELNNYSYEGKGVLWQEDSDEYTNRYYSFYASVFASRALTLTLTGDNTLIDKATDADNKIYGDGIAVIGDMTIQGTGSLTIQAGEDGIRVENGSLTIEQGTVDMTTGDDGIDVFTGDLSMLGGTVTVQAEDHGFDVAGDLTVSNGTVDITAEDNGFNAYQDITIMSGTVTIQARDYGMEGSSITISDGNLQVYGKTRSALNGWNGDVTISGGNMELTTGKKDAISAAGKVSLPESAEVTTGKVTVTTPFLAEAKDGNLCLFNIPRNLVQVMIASYDINGKMLEVQAIAPSREIEIPVVGEKVVAFFLDENYAPICGALIVN